MYFVCCFATFHAVHGPKSKIPYGQYENYARECQFPEQSFITMSTWHTLVRHGCVVLHLSCVFVPLPAVTFLKYTYRAKLFCLFVHYGTVVLPFCLVATNFSYALLLLLFLFSVFSAFVVLLKESINQGSINFYK